MLVDGTKVGKNYADLVDWVEEQDDIQISHLIIAHQPSSKRTGVFLGRLFDMFRQWGVNGAVSKMALELLVHGERLFILRGRDEHFKEWEIGRLLSLGVEVKGFFEGS